MDVLCMRETRGARQLSSRMSDSQSSDTVSRVIATVSKIGHFRALH